MTTIKKKELAQQFGLALTAFTAAWTATGFDERPAAILGSLIAALAGFVKPSTGKTKDIDAEHVS